MTTLCSYLSPNFWPGLKALAHSLAHKGNVSGLDWIVLTDDPAPEEWRDWLGYCGFNMVNLLFSQVGKLPAELPHTADHLVYNWHKLLMFLLPPGEYVFLDADLLCVGDASKLLTMPHISAANERPGKNNGKINAGLIRFDASQELFDECVKAIDMTVLKGFGVGLAEQTILNYVLSRHKGLVHFLDDRWNMPAFLATREPKLWKPDKAIFIHYTGQSKPWMGWERRDREDRMRSPAPVKAIDIWRDYAESIQEIPAQA